MWGSFNLLYFTLCASTTNIVNMLSCTMNINYLYFFLHCFMFFFLILCVFLTSPTIRQGGVTHGIFRSVQALLSILSCEFFTLNYILYDTIDVTL